MASSVNILIADEREDTRRELATIVTEHSAAPYRVLQARFGAEALRILLEEEVAVLFVGPSLPDMTGLELAQMVRRRERTAALPIVFVLSQAIDRELLERGSRVGAVDYLSTPLVPEIVRAKLTMFDELLRQRRLLQQQTDRDIELGLLELRLANMRRYRNLAEAVPNIVWTALPDGTIDYFNRRWFEYTGISVERAAGSWRSVVHPDDLAARDEAWKHALETGQVADIRCRLRRADGKYRWHVCRAVPERGAAGQIVAWLGSFTDIEDERRASAVLTEFKGTLDAVLDAVFIFDASDWHLLYVNLGASALLGYTQEELLDMRRPTDFMAEHDETSFRELLAPILRGEQSTLTLETRFRRKTASTVPVEMSLQLIRVDGGRIVSIARDITERARVRRERELLYRETVDALRARDEFLSIASHELRSPLGALELQITTLLQPPNDPGSAPTGALKKKLEVAARQVEQMSRLITELLDVTRISCGRMDLDREVTDLAALARDLIDRFATDAAKAESTVELDAPEPVIGSWDSLRLDQVLTNLLTNALKFGAGKPIEISVTRVGSNARVTVTDHGIGIEPENLDRIFHRFEQAVSTRTYGGFGLGLYIVRGIVEAHGGTVHVESEPQVRTTFSIELPLQPSREQEDLLRGSFAHS